VIDISNATASVVGQMAGIHLAYTGGNMVANQGVAYMTGRWANRRDETNTLALSDNTYFDNDEICNFLADFDNDEDVSLILATAYIEDDEICNFLAGFDNDEDVSLILAITGFF